ncbi:MAG: HD domain-containing protein [Propionibacteriaceae bacterium]|nr:HD domain-containing protein [Propionibacteriaceae bacterium]
MTAARDLNRLHPVNTFTKITAEEAEHLVETLPRLDRRTFGWVLDELDREPERVSCADVGLASHVRVRRPSASKALFESVRKAPLGTWVKARVFPPDKGSAGRKWVSEVRQGRKHFESLGQLEAVLVPQADGSFEANIRRCVADVPLPELARSLASAAHGLQKDKAGLAYIDHPRRVAERLAGQGEAPEVVAAGWLHDVLEDTTVTAEDLASAGIPDHVVAAVEALTKRAGESLEAYTARVKASPIGVVVKRADIADNTDPARLAILDAATRNRLIAKYSRMGALL